MSRKTILLNPEIEGVVRQMQALIIRNGYTASFSATLNMMLLGHFHNLIRRKPNPHTAVRVKEYLKTGEVNITPEERELFSEFLRQAEVFWKKNSPAAKAT
jgi:hypothetical protein